MASIGPRASMNCATSWRWRLTDSRIHVLAASMTLGQQHVLGHLGGAGLEGVPRRLGAAGLDHHDGHVGVRLLGEGPAGHHQLEGGLVALLVRGVRGATGPFGVEKAMRTAPIGPSKGMPEIMRAADAVLMASTSCGLIWSAPKTVPTTWTSLRKPLGNDGRSGRSMSRQVKMAWSEALPPRRKNEPGILPAACAGSSMSTVRGKKSVPLPHRTGRRRSPSPTRWCRRCGRRRRRRPVGPACRTRTKVNGRCR